MGPQSSEPARLPVLSQCRRRGNCRRSGCEP
jgi:hypothetical protein